MRKTLPGYTDVRAIVPDQRKGLFIWRGSCPTPEECDSVTMLPWDEGECPYSRVVPSRNKRVGWLVRGIGAGPGVTRATVAAFQLMACNGALSDLVTEASRQMPADSPSPFLSLYAATLASVSSEQELPLMRRDTSCALAQYHDLCGYAPVNPPPCSA